MCVGLCTTLDIALLTIFKPPAIELLDARIQDGFLARHYTPPSVGLPVIVDIDERTLGKEGQWPWPRYKLALFLERLRHLGPAAVGMDMVFPEADRASPIQMQQSLYRDLQVEVDFVGLPKGLADYDQVLANMLARGSYCLGYSFRLGGEELSGNYQALCHLKPLSLALIRAEDAPPLSQLLLAPRRVTCNLPLLADAATRSGFINTLPDRDNIIRRTPLLTYYETGDDSSIHPSLALGTLMAAYGIENGALRVGSNGVESLRLGKPQNPGAPTLPVIPLDRRGQLMLNYRGPKRTFSTYSASQIMNNELPPNTLAGKIVFIGTSAEGLKDLRATPLDPLYPGVEVHATVVENILSGEFLTRPAEYRGLELLFILASGFIATIILALPGALWSLPVLALLGGGEWLYLEWLFADYGLFLSPLAPMTTLAALFLFINLAKFIQEERQRQFIHGAFAKFVSPTVVQELVRSGKRLTLTGEEREVTIFFSDIRSFTSYSEQLTPPELTELLSDYFTPVTRTIRTHDGTLDKLIGDAVMAFWNAPLTIENHPCRAVRAALAVQVALERINDEIEMRHGFRLQTGIGLHTGQVRVGNMGSEDIFDYTIIGDNVNLASRIEGLTKYYGLPVLVSETTIQACRRADEGTGVVFVEVDTVQVKGRSEPMRIYWPVPEEEAKAREAEFERYAAALAAYRSREFEDAATRFKALRTAQPTLKLYALYAERAERYAASPPAPDWDGVYVHQSK